MADFIYVLRDPRTNVVRYVGKTKNPSDRKKAHSSPSQVRGQGIGKIEWTMELISLGLRPQFEIIEECEAGKWQERERFWIAHYGLDNLLNVRPDALPGNLNECSENTKEKLRRSVLKQFSDVVRRKKHSDAMKRWSANLTEEDRQKLRDNQSKAIATGAQSKHMKSFWERMTEEQREQFIRERRAKQEATPRKLSDEALFEILSNAHKKVWQNETQRKNRIDGIKAAWSDPVRKAARLEKLAKSMALANEKRSASLKATWEKRRQAQS